MRSSLFLLALCACAAFAQADLPLGHRDFLPTPQRPVGWRGDGSGVFPGATPVTEWDGATGKNILWQVEMPNQTMASPIVVGNRVITLADPHTILCHDATTGARLWYNAQDQLDVLCKDPADATRYRRLWDLYHRFFTSHGPGKNHDAQAMEAAKAELTAAGVTFGDPMHTANGPKANNTADYNPFFTKAGLGCNTKPGMAATLATPVSDGAFVWAWYTSNTAACYDLKDGRTVWMRWLGELKSDPGGYGFPSPVLADGVLVLTCADGLRGLDAATGEPRWHVPYRFGIYECCTPLALTVGGQKVVATFRGLVVRVADGKVLMSGYPGKAPDGSAIKVDPRGNSAFLVGDTGDTFGLVAYRYGPCYVFRLTPNGPDAVTAECLLAERPDAYDHDDGTSCAYNGVLYMNNGWDVLDLATGKATHRQRNAPAGGYPGCNVAGNHLFNFDGAASCGVYDLGLDGQVAAVNHLYAAWAKPSYLVPVGSKIGSRNMGDGKIRTAAWWRQVEQAQRDGVIGWIGRRFNVALGEMTADPFFQGERIYVRTYAHLICIGRK